MNKQTLKTAITKLSRELKDSGVSLPQNKILEMVAKSFGYKNYNTLLGSLDNQEEYSFQDVDFEKKKDYLVIKVLPNKVVYMDTSLQRSVEDDIVDMWEDCRKQYKFDKANITTRIDKTNHLIVIDMSDHHQDYKKPIQDNNNGILFFLMVFADFIKNNKSRYNAIQAISDIRFVQKVKKESNTNFMKSII